MALNLQIRTIPHRNQRYNTVGDYGGTRKQWIHVSDMRNSTYELAIALHELIEQHLIKLAKIPVKRIDAFDRLFEKEYKKGLHKPEDEPGDDPRAPYYWQHQFATALERLFVNQSGYRWHEYEDFVTQVWRGKTS